MLLAAVTFWSVFLSMQKKIKNNPDSILLKATWHLLKWAPLFINCKSILMIKPPPLLFFKVKMSHRKALDCADMQECVHTNPTSTNITIEQKENIHRTIYTNIISFMVNYAI